MLNPNTRDSATSSYRGFDAATSIPPTIHAVSHFSPFPDSFEQIWLPRLHCILLSPLSITNVQKMLDCHGHEFESSNHGEDFYWCFLAQISIFFVMVGIISKSLQ